jgi:hypothetical protein
MELLGSVEWAYGAARKNVAYRALLAKGTKPEDALVICEDAKIVDALVNGVAGVAPMPNTVIENRQAGK